MKRLMLFCIDLCLIATGTYAAALLRANFEDPAHQLYELAPYLLLTLCAAAVTIPVFGLERSVWRFSALPDYLRVLAATAAIVLGAVALGFIANRLEGIARALPVLQAILIACFLVAARVLVRLRELTRAQAAPAVSMTQPFAGERETVLVVGLNRVADLYLRCVAEYAADRVKVAGLLGTRTRHNGRRVHQHAILGAPEDVDSTIRNLNVHGVIVDKIVVSVPFEELSSTARKALLDIERGGNVQLEFIAERLNLVQPPDVNHRKIGSPEETTGDISLFAISMAELERLTRKPYWRVKRGFDILVGAVALIVLAPLFFGLAVLVAIDIGLPVAFWQQRPGRKGYPFRLYKFRSMMAAHDEYGERVPDPARTTIVGDFLRRTRFDELPQLVNILRGDMSFVGPRPLLPADQSPAYAARLLVRPGLTGWAQVKGGRELSARDKAALDIWYVVNASFLLDLKIMAWTVPMLFSRETTNPVAIDRAWHDLESAGICAQGQWAPLDGNWQPRN